MAEGTGKSKIKELKVEVFLDDALRAGLQDILDGQKDILEVDYVYFRHLIVEELKHAGLRIGQLKFPVGRITKLRIKVARG
ncbi:hypothetical protein CIG75_06420 [Tumebacillus algifaecis]|uniref:Uncharacterized protein n=1 Tax=Tumebacillus algifaecis TaxID=1214604 RepID=A0A223CZ56_9BACL|nr:hypothetical protein [Tumebacillus algifaecis]ASS74640.1 hypothetical protein CIG75_06420 [Tumebacillus algifaecis]